MTTPTRGLSLYPTSSPRRLVELAALAEELGYEHLWFGDSQNIWREVYTCMGAVAAGTSRIGLGTGVTNGVTRHRSVVASAWATLHELSGGRVAAGFGVGDSALHTMGRRPMRVAELEELVGELRALWRGDEVKEPSADAPYRLDYLDGPVTVPLYLAASGPKLLALAGRVADGVILLAGTDAATVRSALAVVEEGAASVGRTRADVHVVLWAPVAIDGDAERARARVRAHVARTVLRPIQVDLTPAEQAVVEEIRRSYDYYEHMRPEAPHARLVTDDLVRRFALAGTPESCRQQMRALAAVGVDQVAAVPFPDPAGGVEQLLEDFASL